MRIVVAGILAVLLLTVGGAAAVQVAGDIGPGDHAKAPAGCPVAGDIGPGDHAMLQIVQRVAGDVGPGDHA